MTSKRHTPNRLRKYRRISGYSQLSVAFLLGHKSSNQLSRWERGHAVPSIENLLKLSVLYRVLPNQLYPNYVEAFRKMLPERIKQLGELTRNKDP